MKARHSRRGAALLLVLAVFVVTVTAAAALARAASTIQVARQHQRWTTIADGLAQQAEKLAQEWLNTTSPIVVLAAHAATPEVPVLADTWTIDAQPVAVRVTAWDQCGMVPADLARGGSSLRTTLPRAIMPTVDHALTGARRGAQLGLDCFQVQGGTASAFPLPQTSKWTCFGALSQADPGLADSGSSAPIAVGAWIATHNASPGRINVQTAPLPVIEESMRMSGLGGVEAITEARQRGQRAPVPPAPPKQNEHASQPQLSGDSDCWAFRIDVRVGGVKRSWWTVYRHRSSWECVQRLAVTN